MLPLATCSRKHLLAIHRSSEFIGVRGYLLFNISGSANFAGLGHADPSQSGPIKLNQAESNRIKAGQGWSRL